MGARRRRRSASGEAGWTARLLDASKPDVGVQRLGEDEDRLRSGDGNRQDSARLHGRRGSRSVAERAVLGVRRISRLPASVQRRRGSWKIGPADREGEWLAARGHEAGGDQRVKYHGDQQNAGHELAPAAIEESRAHVLQEGCRLFRESIRSDTRPRVAGTLPRATALPDRCVPRALDAIASQRARYSHPYVNRLAGPRSAAFLQAACVAPCEPRRTVAGVPRHATWSTSP